MADDREPNDPERRDPPDAEAVGIRPRVTGLARPSAERVRARAGRSAHRRFQPAAPPHPDWTSFSAQRHVRDIAVGLDGLRVWLATWGGVLCWTPGDGRVERHGSDHGLLGNTTRCVAVDRAGIVWVGQDNGLCSLDVNAPGGWRQHDDLAGRTITHVRARPAGGVYVAFSDTAGRGAIGEIAGPSAPLRVRLQSHQAAEDVAALVPALDGTLWLGNAWGIFHDQGGASPAHYDLSVDDEGKRAVQQQVRSLAIADGGALWVGTTWGLYALRPGQRPEHAAVSSVRGTIRSLATNPADNRLLVLTDDSVGEWDGREWSPIATTALGRQAIVASASI